MFNHLKAIVWGNIAAALVACAASGADTTPSLKIGFIGRSAGNPVYQVAAAGARQAAIDLGATYETKITIVDLTPPTGDPQLQAAAINELVHEGADGLTITPADPSALTPAIDAAVKAGLSVATFNVDAPASQRFFGYMADNEQCGYTLTVQLAKAMSGKGVVAILNGAADSQPQTERINGIKAAIKIYPGLTLKGIYSCDESVQGSAARIAAVMKANPDITGWILNGSWPLSGPHAFAWAPGTVKCVAVGILPSQLQYIRDGYVQMVIAQPFYEWGYRTVERLVYRLSLSRKPPTPIEYAALTVVTPENVAAFAQSAAGWNVK